MLKVDLLFNLFDLMVALKGRGLTKSVENITGSINVCIKWLSILDLSLKSFLWSKSQTIGNVNLSGPLGTTNAFTRYDGN